MLNKDKHAAIVIPCYNESNRLYFTEFERFLALNLSITLVFSNDGSSDNTLQLLESFQMKHPEKVQIIDFRFNSGKAETIRKSFIQLSEKKKYFFLGFLDADLSTPLSEMANMLPSFADTSVDIVMGCRLRRLGTVVQRSVIRHYLGRVFATLASLSLKIPVYDTQCGAKWFKSEVIEQIINEPFRSSWFFDIELLKRYLILRNFKIKTKSILELPLNRWVAVDGSKVKSKDFLFAPLELLKIHLAYERKEVFFTESGVSTLADE